MQVYLPMAVAEAAVEVAEVEQVLHCTAILELWWMKMILFPKHVSFLRSDL